MNDPPHKTLPERTVLNEGTEEEIGCYGYKQSAGRTILTYLGIFCSGGLLLLIFYWKPEWSLKAQYIRCSLREAEAVLLKDIYRRWHTAKVERTNVELPDDSTFQKRKYPHKTPPSNTPTEPLDGDFKEKGVNGSMEKVNTHATHVANSQQEVQIFSDEKQKIKFFRYQKLKYLWDPYEENFYKLRGLDIDTPCSDFYSKYNGMSLQQQDKRRNLYGENLIGIELKPIFLLFITEAMNPFYIFQLYSVLLWIIGYQYIYFSVAILVMSMVSISLTVYSTRKQAVTLRQMVESSTDVTVWRGGDVYDVISERDLVPGDVITLPLKGCVMTCDAVLVAGSCIVNESMLTGESVPITKTALPPEEFGILNTETHKRHILFCGTDVIQCRRGPDTYVRAVVLRTGFSTSKGTLVRSILYPKPMDFKLYRDAMRFIGVLASIAAIGFVLIITVKIMKKATVKDIIIKALDIFTIAVPPALPAALTIGMVFAQRRLKKKGIFCISPQRINVSGTLDVVCFDKTGTLTEDHLELLGVAPITSESLIAAMPEKFSPDKEGSSFVLIEDPSKLPSGPVLHCMGACHSITLIDGELRGDPLDLQMFAATKWHLKEPKEGEETDFRTYMPTIVRPMPWPGETPEGEGHDGPSSAQEDHGDQPEIGILRQFTFSSAFQRMSVITQAKGSNNLVIYVKGAPEKVAAHCDNLTVPDDFQEVLQEYTHQGLRVLAIAYRILDESITYSDAQRITREQVESDLTFLGLLIMQNTLKPETNPVIAQLSKARIRTVMVTGDNILTAIHVARKCGMIDEKETVVRIDAHAPTSDEGSSIQYTIVRAELHGRAFCRASDSEQSKISNENSALVLDDEEDFESVKITMDGDAEKVDHSTYHFAMDGKTFAVIMEHFPDLVPKIAVRGTVFARMSPDQKAQLVEALQSLEYYVGMCGDGANDCGALKTAHAGISLSEAEASVASPFTSRTPNIECIPTLIKEGRAALVTSFGVFKYMAMYSMIQFISVIILNTIQSFPGDWMFMYWDIAITTTVALFAGRNEAYPKIVARKPQSQLMEAPMIFSIVCMILLQMLCQVGGYFFLTTRAWFTPLEPIIGDMNILCYESTVVFYISAFQYIIVAFLFSKGPPFRKPLYTNIPYTIGLIILTLFTAFLVIYPTKPLEDFFMLMDIPDLLFRVLILALALANFLAAIIIEVYIANSSFVKNLLTCKKCRGKDTLPRYMQLQNELSEDHHWPPITHKDMEGVRNRHGRVPPNPRIPPAYISESAF
ncbi:polyamine-transporting ATPase 13A3 [Saccoglossus kowalevskii]|uniref:Cation-transporting ATPase n=1 Tax=Saccoglossus kowalevskii TaxID=10224 RepID=A0ABM0LVU1_SACKO|nr:PREDICTED: probable cation-transporting ATPase 13A3 [Saccoglossus kowalevskii]